VAWAAAHSAWGQAVEIERRGAEMRGRVVESPFRLLGQYADQETRLCYTRFRYFDAQLGRWCSPDPLGIAGGANLFAVEYVPLSSGPSSVSPPLEFDTYDAFLAKCLALLRDVAPDQQKNRQDTKAAKEELQGPPRHLPLLFPCFLAPLAPWRFASQPYFPQ
jgi:RHS repeat-associated protein